MEKEIELKIKDMSAILHPAEAYALLLQEVGGERKLPIIIGSQEAQSIKAALMNYQVPRPLTHDLIVSLISRMNIHLQKVLIYKVKEGVFYSYLFFEFSTRFANVGCYRFGLALSCFYLHFEDNFGTGSFAGRCRGKTGFDYQHRESSCFKESAGIGYPFRELRTRFHFA